MTTNGSQNPMSESRSDIGPSYTALILTRGPSEDEDPNSGSPSSSEPSSPAHTWTGLGPFRFIPRRDIPLLTRDLDGDSNSNSNSTSLPLSRAQLQLRSSRLNEPSTALGRRVAARQGSDAPAPTSQRTYRTLSVADLMRVARRQRQNEVRTGSNINATENSQSNDRPPLLSGMATLRALRDSRDRLRLEARASPSRVVPRSYRSDELDADQIESRGYRVRRRLNADGDELIYNIHMDPESPRPENQTWEVSARRRSPTLAFPPVDLTEQSIGINNQRNSDDDNTRVDGDDIHTLPPPFAQRIAHRRRGWARLDADGNEITTDEEEAVERVRARIRVREQSNSAQNVFQVVRERLVVGERLDEDTVLSPTTQPVSPDMVDEDYIPRVRVQINSRGSDQLPDLPDLLATQSYPAYRVNPLPTPLTDMVDSYFKPKTRICNTKVVKVSRFANLAGR